MKQHFRGYYRPSQEEFEALWAQAFFALDANVLLHMHRYQPAARQEFLDVLRSLDDRLWVPHQAALEYQRRRLDVIQGFYQTFSEVADKLNGFEETLLQWARSYSHRHPILNSTVLEEKMRTAIDDVRQYVKQAEDEQKQSFGENYLQAQTDVLDELTSLLENKVGDPYSNDEVKKIYEDGRERYERKQPPGFKDEKKQEPDRYGDYVLWRQLLDKAKSKKQPVILITDDRKEDWWRQHRGKTVGPRPELIDEMFDVAGCRFYMYEPQVFLEWSGQMLDRTVSPETIQNVEASNLAFGEEEGDRGSAVSAASQTLGDLTPWLALDGSRLPINWALPQLQNVIPDYTKLLQNVTPDYTKLLSQVAFSTPSSQEIMSRMIAQNLSVLLGRPTPSEEGSSTSAKDEEANEQGESDRQAQPDDDGKDL